MLPFPAKYIFPAAAANIYNIKNCKKNQIFTLLSRPTVDFIIVRSDDVIVAVTIASRLFDPLADFMPVAIFRL